MVRGMLGEKAGIRVACGVVLQQGDPSVGLRLLAVAAAVLLMESILRQHQTRMELERCVGQRCCTHTCCLADSASCSLVATSRCTAAAYRWSRAVSAGTSSSANVASANTCSDTASHDPHCWWWCCCWCCPQGAYICAQAGNLVRVCRSTLTNAHCCSCNLAAALCGTRPATPYAAATSLTRHLHGCDIF